MEYDKLVNLIVEEVLKKIDNLSTSTSNKPLAIIFNEVDLNQYLKLYSSQYDVKVFDENIRECELVIITRLCLRGMANLAHLISSTSEESFIVKMLMKGKKICIVEEGLSYKRYKGTAPKQIYSKYLEFEKILKNYGIEFISNSVNININKNKNDKNEEKSIIIHKKLISESDIRKQYISGTKVIFIDSKSIITPLAEDYIKMNHIEIIKKER